MKAASINEIKQELENLPAPQLAALCLRLAKFKKENKELLTYLLFENFDEQAYIQNVKQEMDEQFEEVNKTNIYFAKKSFRKILRATNKYIRFTQSKQAEVELLLHFCSKIKSSGVSLKRNAALNNLYQNQLKKINKTIGTMHEDLQYDYIKEVEKLID
jgi:hypothetical protein